MAEVAPASLGDFFGKKVKKKIKATNLNNTSSTEKPEEKKVVKKSAEEDGWQEDEVVAATMKVGAAGNLIRQEEKPEAEESSAPAWGTQKKAKDNPTLNDRRFPTLAKAVQSSAINMEDTSGKINISTSRNMFSNLEVDDGSEDDQPKRPKEIKPALVTKKKGEMAKDAVKREVGKFGSKMADGADEEEEVPKERKAVKKEKKAKQVTEDKDEDNVKEVAEDLKMNSDSVASKAKYQGRKKLDRKDLPPKELLEDKENKPPQGGSKKKKAFVDEEDDEKSRKLAYWED
eukprot:TRINITY_DN97681_c0_g1_i1.p1 TRINITY_DN97681_c0_g1~~TRINITY_DN97681_c0_g1_i1.p1  ORF type:complete len:288 (+),score=116.68 TRINITY_DN97681_c0_g1_i1:69-932(+)